MIAKSNYFFYSIIIIFMAYLFITPVEAALYDFPYKKIARLIAKKATEKNKVKIAILTYQSLDDQSSKLGEIISQQIIVELVNTSSLNIVERSQVERLLKELQFNQTGAIDAATAKKIGNGLGADALVIGSYSEAGNNQIIIFSKLVDTETFQVLGASQESARKELTKDNRVILKKEKDEESRTLGVDKEQLINRRVLILDFVNAMDAADYSYLEESIPDAFSDPLDKTNSFELISGNIWKEMLKNQKFGKKDAWVEKNAIEAGRLAEADVVVIGKFVAMGDRIEIFSKAVELSSGRVMVSRKKTAPLNNRLFQAIYDLTIEMSSEMKEKLPPLPQRVITVEREKYIVPRNGDGQYISYGGMIWRSIVVPGWGHLYADQWRGWIYMPLWAGSVGTFVVGIIDFNAKEAAYNAATSGLEAAYAEYNDARKLRNFSLIAVLSMYAISIGDILITGNGYINVEESRVLPTLDFSIEPEVDGFRAGFHKKW